MLNGTLLTPERAYLDYVKPHIHKENWLYKSDPIESLDLDLSVRELLGCILMAHLYKGTRGSEGPWHVGYDNTQAEPNDGLVQGSRDVYRMEHKIITNYQGRTTLDALVDLYDTYNNKGANYGKDRTLLIQADAPSGPPGAPPGVLIKVSGLKDHIATGECHFDHVMLIYVVSRSDAHAEFRILQSHPAPSGNPLYRVYFDLMTGSAKVIVHVGPDPSAKE